MDYILIKDFKDNADQRKYFNELAGIVFGIDFERWYQLGFWNDRHICYSYIYGGRVVANVSASMLDIVINGERARAVQIGTVMTHPEHRRKGLAERLMNIVLSEYEKDSDMIFLFANMDAIDFYKRFEFAKVSETQFSTFIALTKTGASVPAVRKLDLSSEKDIEILCRLASSRLPLSSAFWVDHAEGILKWHCLNIFPEDLYYIEKLDTIVICRICNGKIDLYDVVYRNKPDLKTVAGAVLQEMDQKYEVIFHFTPDFDDINIISKTLMTEEYVFYVKSDKVSLPKEFFYPYTAHA